MRDLMSAATNWTSKHGVKIVEAYPSDSVSGLPASSIYTGVVQAFSEAGFVEVLRRSQRRPIMRKIIG